MKLTKTRLRNELAETLAAIAVAQEGDIERATSVASVAALMNKSWILRYQLASLDYDACRTPLERVAMNTVMVKASKEAEAWARRQITARKAVLDDDVEDAKEHERSQAALAERVRLVKS
jgi:hypothetical protein